jgi:hypothetical protein
MPITIRARLQTPSLQPSRLMIATFNSVRSAHLHRSLGLLERLNKLVASERQLTSD